MHRSFAEAFGFNWRPDVAMVVNGKPVTWAEVHENRRKRDERNVGWKRRVEEPAILPAYVWTFFNRQSIPYHGWYCYVVTRHDDIAVNFLRFDRELAESIMRAVPLGVSPTEANFERWMRKFAKQHPRPRHPKDPRQAGSIVGWLERRKWFTLERPK